MSPPLSDMEHSVRAALEDSRCKAALFSTQLLEARSDLERTQQLQLQLVARQLGAAGGKTRSDDGTDTRSSMARARAEVEEEMTAQHEVLVEGVRQRLRAVRERALADATSHLDAVSEAGPRRVCERIARCDHRTAAAQQQLEHLITQWQRERAAHAESIAARRRARLEGHYGAQRRFLLFDGRRPPVSDSWNQFAGRRTADALQLGARGRARARRSAG